MGLAVGSAAEVTGCAAAGGAGAAASVQRPPAAGGVAAGHQRARAGGEHLLGREQVARRVDGGPHAREALGARGQREAVDGHQPPADGDLRPVDLA